MTYCSLKPPVLAILTGVPASGKSTIINGLYNSRGIKVEPGLIDLIDNMVLIDKDRLKGVGNFVNPRNLVYDYVKAMILVTPSWSSVLIDATFADEVGKPGWADPYSEIAAARGYKFKLGRCIAPDKVIKDRMKGRNRDIDRGKYATTESWVEHRKKEPISSLHGGNEFDTTRPHKESLDMMINFFMSPNDNYSPI